MARGSEPNSTVSTREQRTEELLLRLTDAVDAERELIIEEIVGLNLGLCDALANRYAAIPQDDSPLQNVVDEIAALYLRTLYKLKNLQ